MQVTDKDRELAFECHKISREYNSYTAGNLHLHKLYKVIGKYRDALLAEHREDQWQDISTAPKDGTFILVGCTKYRDVDQVHWELSDEYWRATGGKCKGGNFLDYDPDIWMHMPTTPKVKDE